MTPRDPNREEHVPVPVAAAERIGEEYAKDVVVIMTWSGVSASTHSTTWGRELRHKHWAAALAPQFAAIMGAGAAGPFFEDFRNALPTLDQVEGAGAATSDPDEAARFANLAAMMRLAQGLEASAGVRGEEPTAFLGGTLPGRPDDIIAVAVDVSGGDLHGTMTRAVAEELFERTKHARVESPHAPSPITNWQAYMLAQAAMYAPSIGGS